MAANVTFNINAVDKTKGVFEKVTKQTQKASKATGQMGFKAQQAGYQVQDFFVQIGSGTSKMRAFSQQAPQLLGIFGPGGAIAGAALAIGAVTAQMIGAKNAADKAAEALKTYNEYAQELNDILEDRRFERLSDFGKQSDLTGAIETKQKELKALQDTVTTMQSLRLSPTGFSFIDDKVFKFLAGNKLEEAQQKIGQAQTKLAELQKRLGEVNKKVGDESATALSKIEDSSKSIADNLRKSVMAIVDKNLTPFERFEKKMIELRDLFRSAGSLFPKEFFDREAARLRSVFEKDVASGIVKPPKRAATDRFTRVGLISSRATSAADIMQSETKKQTSLLEDIRDAIRRNNEKSRQTYQMGTGILT